MIRVAVYVDGFNLYFGLRERYGRKYLWLDLQVLAASLLRPDQSLEKVRYFTARVRNDVAGQQRQSDYLDALGERSPLVEIRDGRFQEMPRMRQHLEGLRGEGDRRQHRRRPNGGCCPESFRYRTPGLG